MPSGTAVVGACVITPVCPAAVCMPFQGFYFGREVPPDSPEASKPLHGPNQWPAPALLPRYREVTQAYFDALRGLGMR